MGDYERAIELCALGSQWGIEGIIRMEAGFELILCNFTEGLEFVSAMKPPASDKPEGYGESSQFEYIRGLAARYQSITAGRVQVDYSSMVSAYFYPLNLTNPVPAKAELPRLSVDDELDLERVRADLRNVLSRPQPRESSIDWQGVVDMIVTRYGDRLKFMASDATTRKALQSDINFLLSVFIDYKDPSLPTAIEKCTSHYLKAVIPRMNEDHLIHAAISTVSHKICSTLFEVRAIILEEDDSNLDEGAVKAALKI
jgi:hypothetical protein